MVKKSTYGSGQGCLDGLNTPEPRLLFVSHVRSNVNELFYVM